MRGRLERCARRVASSRHIPPAGRRRLGREILEHLEDAAAAYRTMGYASGKAERAAVRDFGYAPRIRKDLGRAFRRRRVVLFPRSLHDHLLSVAIYYLPLIVIVIAAACLVRWQVVGAYYIPSKSMEPTLHGQNHHGGDTIVVSQIYYDLFPPRRWQVVVFSPPPPPHKHIDFVKRIAGLPGEVVNVEHGDLYIDGHIVHKPREVENELLVPVFTDDLDQLSFVEGEAKRGLAAWNTVGTWREAQGVYAGTAGPSGKATLSFAEPIRDEYPGEVLKPEHAPRPVVGDLLLEFHVTPGRETKTIGAALREGENHFEVRIPVGGGDTVLLENKQQMVVGKGLFFRPGTSHEVRFANLDQRVTLEVDGKLVTSDDVAKPSYEGDEDEPAAQLGFRDGTARFSGLTLERDIYYYRSGNLPAQVPPHCYFMLGDNSVNSSDSRDWGSVPFSRFVGRAMFVLWPLSHAKLLH